MTRTKRAYVWLTEKEFQSLIKNVKKSGLCRKYLWHLIACYEVKEERTEEWVILIRMLSSMANNLNQLTRLSHAKGEVSDWNVIRQMREVVSEIFGNV